MADYIQAISDYICRFFPDSAKYTGPVTKEKYKTAEFLDILTIQNDFNKIVLVNDNYIVILTIANVKFNLTQQ